MPEILTESFCERCGTRYTFEAAEPKGNKRLGKLKTLSKGFVNFVSNDETSFDEAFAEARSDEQRELTNQQLEAFHQTFQFCMSCRQYTCANCWNDIESRCLSCSPLIGSEASGLDPLARFGFGQPGGAPATPNGNGHAQDAPAAIAEPVEPSPLDVLLGSSAWPASDLASPDEAPGLPVSSVPPAPSEALAPAQPTASDVAPPVDFTAEAATPNGSQGPADESPAVPRSEAFEAFVREGAAEPSLSPDGPTTTAAGDRPVPAVPDDAGDDADVARAAAAAALARQVAQVERERQLAAEHEAEAQRQAEAAAEVERARQEEARRESEAQRQRQEELVAEAEREQVAAVAAEAERQRQADEARARVAEEEERARQVEADRQREAKLAAEAALAAAAEREREAQRQADAQRKAELEAEAGREREAAEAAAQTTELLGRFRPEPAPGGATPAPSLPSQPGDAAPERVAAHDDRIETPTWQVVAPEAAPVAPAPATPASPSPLNGAPLNGASAPTNGSPAAPPAPTNGAPSATTGGARDWPSPATTPPPQWPMPAAGTEPQWPTRPGANPSTDLWVASSQDVLQRPGPAGVQACVSCGLPLSASARFCRRCGTSQH